MPNSSVRTVLLFGIIALVLVGAIVGGVRLMKARNDSYVATSQGKVAQADTKQQPAQQKTDTPKPATSDQKSTSNSSPTQQPQKQPADTAKNTTAVPPVTNPTPTPSANDKKDTTPAPTATPQPAQRSNLPATSGFALGDVAPTIVMMALAGFFGSRLLRARADYRRYIGS